MPVMKCSTGEWKIGNDGDCRYDTKEKAEAAQQAYYAQKNESVYEDEGDRDTVSMDHSFLLRIMELMREYEDMDDVLLHKVADRIIEKGGETTLTMDHYSDVVQDLDREQAGYGSDDDVQKEDVLNSPNDWDDGDRGEIEDDPEHRGKRELDELIKRAGIS